MTLQFNDIDDWELEVIQKRYHGTYGISLTHDQAKNVYAYEQLLELPSIKDEFSMWEEFDFELASFQDILTPEQLKTYKAKREELIRLNEERLVEEDIQYLKQLEAAKDLLQYYDKNLLPNLEQPKMALWQLLANDREKVVYLRAEYRRFLDDFKKSNLVNHFRHNKTLQPNLLKLSLLNHQLMSLLPDYSAFRGSMEAQTRSIADYIEGLLKISAAMAIEGLSDTLHKLEEFQKANTAKHLGELRGWHSTGGIVENNLMFLLLLHPDKKHC